MPVINPYRYVTGGNQSLINIITGLGLTSNLKLALDAGDSASAEGAFIDDANTLMLLHFDGSDASTTFTDSSSNAFTITPVGDAQIDTAQSVYGGASGLFDGTGDYLTTNTGATGAVGTGDFTIEFWMRPNASGETNRGIFGNRRDGGGSAAQWAVKVGAAAEGGGQADGALAFHTGAGIILANGTALSSGTWYHIAFVRASGTLTYYLNGASEGTAALSNNFSSTENFSIAGNDVFATGAFNGWLDNLRYSDSARYTANFTPPGRRWLDTSGGGYDFKSGDGSTTTTFPTFNGTPGGLSSAEYWSFDGGDYFTYDTTNETWMDALHKASATWTTIAAFRLGATGSLQTIFSTMSGGSGTGIVLHVTAGDKLQITVRNAGSVVMQQAMDAVTLTSGTWYVVGASVDTGGNSLKWRVRGTSETDTATYTSPSSSAADGFKIATFTGVSSSITNNSRMAALAIWSSALTDAQMGNIIAYIKSRLG